MDFFQLNLKISFLFLEIMQGLIYRVLRHRMVITSAMGVNTQSCDMVAVLFHSFIQRSNEFPPSYFF
jgi:ABC-type transport system involved in Fe-S cluster assembly fused permease/ATPase subunit